MVDFDGSVIADDGYSEYAYDEDAAAVSSCIMHSIAQMVKSMLNDVMMCNELVCVVYSLRLFML